MSPGEVLAKRAEETWEIEDIKLAIRELEQEGTLLGPGDTVRALELGTLLFNLEDMLTRLEESSKAIG